MGLQKGTAWNYNMYTNHQPMVLGFQPSTPCTFHSTANMSIEIAHRTNPTHGKSSFGRIFAREADDAVLRVAIQLPWESNLFPLRSINLLQLCHHFDWVQCVFRSNDSVKNKDRCQHHAIVKCQKQGWAQVKLVLGVGVAIYKFPPRASKLHPTMSGTRPGAKTTPLWRQIGPTFCQSSCSTAFASREIRTAERIHSLLR